MDIHVDTSDLLHWARYMETVPDKTDKVVSVALNQLGDSIERHMSIALSSSTGLPVDQVRGLLDVSRASPDNLTWSMDASRVGLYSARQRRLPTRSVPERPSEEFAATSLVNVLTAGDERVCPKCEEIAANGPYTVEVARAMIPHHPNCRCSVTPFTPRRRLPVTFTTRFGAAPKQSETATLTIPKLIEEMLKSKTFQVLIE